MLSRRALVLAATLVLGLLLVPVGPAGAVSAGPQLEPSSGPAGTSIRVTPNVQFSGRCTVTWDGQPVDTFPCGPDAATGVLGSTTLTAQGAPGAHKVLVCLPSCDGVDAPAFAESTTFTVLAVVPELGSLSLADAGQRLKDAGLGLGTVQGPSGDPAARVSGQVPPAGAAVAAGTAVDLTVRLPGPVLVTVPDLIGHSAGDAEAAVAAAGLVLNATGPATGTVRTQDPAPGTQVRRRSAVAVTLAVAGSPSPITTTPPAAAGGAGLPIGLVLLAVAVVLAVLAVRMLRRAPRRRSSRWVHEHIRLSAGASSAQPGDTHIGEAGPKPTHAVGLEPHRDRGVQTLEEVNR